MASSAAGCSVVSPVSPCDHRRRRRSSGVAIDGVKRHDLGFYELLYTIVLFAVVLVTTRRRRYDGYVAAVAATSYAPVRFALDFLRVRDATYAGLTPAQWACFPLLALGLYFVARGRLRDG
jgi:prolipoprotein diacylglyceryltransferase